MDYLLFFWFSWILWVIVSFFMPRTRFRFYLATLILVLIITVPLSFSGEHYDLSLAYFILMTAGCMWVGLYRSWQCVNVVATALAIMFLYAAIQLSYWFSPVIFLISDVWVPAALIFFVTVFIQRYSLRRYPLIIMAFCFGELIAAVATYPLKTGFYLADENFFNTLSAVVMLMLIWHGMELFMRWMNEFQSRRQKTSYPLSL